MPNHIQNVMRFKSAEDHSALSIVANHWHDENFLDFETIVWMPEIIREVVENDAKSIAPLLLGCKSGMVEAWSWLSRCAKFKDIGPWPGIINQPKEGFREFIGSRDPELLENAERMIKAYAETGYTGWYDWSIANWGTKWNSYNGRRVDNDLRFQTAWSSPIPILRRLSKSYPDIDWSFYAFDEGWNFYITGESTDGGFHFERHVPDWDNWDDATLHVHRICYGCDPERDEDDDAA